MNAESNQATVTKLIPVEFDAIAGWSRDDHAAALACFKISARRMIEKPYTTKALGIDAKLIAGLGALALDAEQTPRQARLFFERNFSPLQIVLPCGAGFVTGYFEPVLAGSPVRTARFSCPLYSRPPDLADIDASTRPAGMDASFMFAKKTASGFVEYHDRAAIESGALAGSGLELAWLESPIDAFFVHIQGSARLTMANGEDWRISYAAKSGHAFTPIGGWLAANGQLRREEVTMDAIRSWLEVDAQRAQTLMQRNQSFIFFQRTWQDDPALGPLAAAAVALTPGRSLAVDHRLHTFGTPVFVSTRGALPGDVEPMARLMIAQDTGSAIIGPARGDLFIGSGEAAGSIAGAVKHQADFYALVPRAGMSQAHEIIR